MVMESRKNSAPVGVAQAEAEMIADFVGDRLFTDNGSGLEAMVSDIEVRRRPKVIRYLMDFVSYLKKKLSGLKEMDFDLSHLEDSFNRMLSEATQKNTAKDDGVRYSIKQYSKDQINNWKSSKKIVVYSNEQQLVNFVQDAVDGKNLSQKMYFGMVSEDLAQRIKKDTGLDLLGRNITLRAGNIRKILLNSHGNQAQEQLRGQRAVNISDFTKIIDVIGSPDKIERSQKDYNGKPAVLFEKTIARAQYTIIAVDSGSSLDLFVQTMYIGTKKWSIANVTNAEALIITPETSVGTAPTDSISESGENVNKKFSVATESTSIPSEAKELLERYERGEISREEYLTRMGETWARAGEEYRTIPEGEKADFDHKVPKKVTPNRKVKRFVRTVLETGALSDEAVAELDKEILLGKFSYDPISDDSAVERADNYVKSGAALTHWNRAVFRGGTVGKETVAVGERLLSDAMKAGDTKRILELSAELSDMLTRAGQAVQAARMLKKMTGIGRLMSAQQVVHTLNDDLEKKYKGRKTPIRLDETIAEQLASSETEEDIEIVYQDVLQNIADQTESTFLDKWNAWRYFAMLANPRTHIRNIVGNAIFYPVVKTKDLIAAGLESGAVRLGLMEQGERTKAVVLKKEYLDFAKRDVLDKDVIRALESRGKMNEETEIDQKRRIFKNEVLEFVTRGNGTLLELEDTLFKNAHYRRALAEYLQVRGVDLGTIDETTLADARTYAVLEAKKATFNDENAVATALRRFSNTNVAAEVAVGGVLPFKKTPVNIVRRGIEYSPIGLAKTLTKGLYDVKHKNISATEFIDGLASGLTGAGITAIGMLLSSLGWVSGGFGDDDEDEFKELNGEQEYAVQIFGKSYSIDWAAPACIPFFVGVELVNAMRETESFRMADITDAMWHALEPITNLSMLQGLQSTIQSTKWAEGNQVIASIVGDTVTSYFMQAVPSLFGATARTVDPVQRAWYMDKNSWFDAFSQSVANNVASKIPGISRLMTPSVDAWGREKERGGLVERIGENFLSPGYYSDVRYDDVNSELMRIYEATGETVYPKTAGKSFAVNGTTKYLTAKEYEEYAKAKGQYSYQYVSELMGLDRYKTLDDSVKASVISNLYNYANAKAKTRISDYKIPDTYRKAYEADLRGESVAEYYLSKAGEQQVLTFSTAAITEAFAAGKDEDAYTAIADLIREKTEAYVANGKEPKKAESEARSDVKSSVTSYWKPLYLAAHEKGNEAEMYRIQEALYGTGLYGTVNEVLKTCRNWENAEK